MIVANIKNLENYLLTLERSPRADKIVIESARESSHVTYSLSSGFAWHRPRGIEHFDTRANALNSIAVVLRRSRQTMIELADHPDHPHCPVPMS